MTYSPQDGFPYYLDLAGNSDCQILFASTATLSFLETISEEKSTFRYAAGKWSIKQVVGHIVDHERIKMSRAFWLSRNQQLQLWGYDQVALVQNARFDEQTFQELFTDYKNVREASHSFVCSLSTEQLQIKGKAKDQTVPLSDFLRTIIGHELHHINILKEKYL
ncbi:DinB family protein [Flagellimonas flava]|uniref:DinB family protein n=1 Tax=Flagellimonas flava TaxID=570519 RepID=UPI003D648D57